MATYGNGYQRFSMFPPVIRWLIVANVAIFIVEALILPGLAGGTIGPNRFPITHVYLALWPIDTEYFGVWQYFTYMFEHGGFSHLFLNMLVLWMFGIELEQTWGSKKFLMFYLACGLGAGIIHSLVTLFMGPGAPTVGASGAIMGVSVAFAMMFPNRMVYAFFFFPLPARLAMMLFIGIDLVRGVLGGSDIAHFAHLGGALIGFLLLKTGGLYLMGGPFKRMKQQEQPGMEAFRTAPRPQEPVYSRGNVIDVNFREAPRHAAPRMNFGDDQARIDAILDKISRQGYQSLTDEEKAVLMNASRRM